MKRKPLKFEDIKIGMKVIDKDGKKGVITKINSIHDVLVKIKGGTSLYCLKRGCKEIKEVTYDGKTVKFPIIFYSPLYKAK